MPSLFPGQALGPEWRVERFEPGTHLLLQKSVQPERARARSSLVVALGAFAAAAALLTATPAGMALVTWPVAGLLVVVAALAIPAAVRGFRRAREGVRLEAQRETAAGWLVAEGALHDPRAHCLSQPAHDVAKVVVKKVEHPPLVLSMLEVVLVDGRRLAGPEVASAPSDPPPLDDAARALAAIWGVSTEV